jgi:hypothetical protein
MDSAAAFSSFRLEPPTNKRLNHVPLAKMDGIFEPTIRMIIISMGEVLEYLAF